MKLKSIFEKNKYINYYNRITYKYDRNFEQIDNKLQLFWWNETDNIGDALNPYLANKITDKEIQWVPTNVCYNYYLSIGSVLQLSTEQTNVWGSGFIAHNAYPIGKPNNIYAVRGPLTWRRLNQLGIESPKNFGDPALLLPKFYNKELPQKVKIGIIPHYVDKNNQFFNQKFPESIKIIDVQNISIQSFIDEILMCEYIASSSLHGLILADAYGIPSKRISFSKNIVGGDFKYADYYKSLNRDDYEAKYINFDDTYSVLFGLNYSLSKITLTDQLLDSCPFNR